MKKDLRLSIPNPCQEKWSSFTTTAQGGFCGSCQKEVIDFTTWSDDRIKAYFKTPPAHACGKFRGEQLKVYTHIQPKSARFAWLPLFVAGIISLFTSRQAVAQIKSTPITEQYQPSQKLGKAAPKSISPIQITGIVKFAEDSTTLPGVNVIHKGTTEGTATDADGKFSLSIKNPSVHDVLVFSFIGLKTVEYAVDLNQPAQHATIVMLPDYTELSGEIIVGGVVSTRWYSPRRWWWGVRNLFRR